MAEEVLGSLVNDLLSRVQKLEAKTTEVHDHDEMQNYLATLDRVSFSMTIAIDVLSKVLIDKGLTTKEELDKALTEERARITKILEEQMKKENPGT